MMKRPIPQLNEEVKVLRREVGQKRIGGGLATTLLYVTHCANEAIGAAKKYPRITAVETIETSDTSLEGIKVACTQFFGQEGKEAIIMKNDKGFTVQRVDQLNLKKEFCVRFNNYKGKSEPLRSGIKPLVSPRNHMTECAPGYRGESSRTVDSSRVQSGARQSRVVQSSKPVAPSSLRRVEGELTLLHEINGPHLITSVLINGS